MSLTKVSFSMIQGEVVNVLDYGATGDGVTDDTAGYLAAIATGKNVYFPKGIYRVAPVTSPFNDRTSSAVLSANQTIFGDGAGSVIEWNTTVVPAPNKQTLMMIRSGSNITVRDLRLTGASLAVQITATADGGVQNVNFENLVVDNVGIGLGIGEQIALNPSGSKYIKNVTVKNCKFDTIGVHGVLFTNIYGFICDGCYFNNIGYFPTTGGFCVNMSQGSRYGTLTNCIAENSRYFCKTESFPVAPATEAVCLSHHISIVNNSVRNMVPQVVSGPAATSEMAIFCNHGASNIIISENDISYPSTGTALFLSDLNSTATGPTLISSNILTTAYYGIGLFMNNSGLNTQVVVEGNTIATAVGCRVQHTNTDIKNNSIETSITGIEITDPCTGISILGNKIISNDYGVLFNASVSDVLIGNNKVISTTNYIYTATGTHSNIKVIGNYFRGANGGYLASVNGLVVEANSITTSGTTNFPSINIATSTNAVIAENTVNTNSSNPNVSIQVAGTLTNVLVENNRTSRTVSVGAGTNVVAANNAFALGYTA